MKSLINIPLAVYSISSLNLIVLLSYCRLLSDRINPTEIEDITVIAAATVAIQMILSLVINQIF